MDLSTTMRMGAYNNRLWYILIILVILIEISQSSENGTTAEGRRGRVSGRIVKLYSGIKNDPILCPREGFLADPVDCSVFYRCLKASNGKYTVFRFQCGPGTVYDPETEVCNHPHSTKRSECGGFVTFVENNKDNEIEGLQQELPSPITTKPSIIIEHSVTKESVTISPPSKSEFTTKGFDNFNTYLPATPSQTIHQQDTHYPQSSYDTWPITSQNILGAKETNTNTQKGELCTTEGFMGDTSNCRKFYRCVNNQHGGFLRYEFMCSNSTVWDDDIQGCNHVWAARNRRCGKYSMNELTHINPFHQFINSKNISGSEQKQTQSNFVIELYESQKQTGYGLNQNQPQYGDKINNEVERTTILQNRYPSTSSTQMSSTQSQINYGNNEQYTQQQNTVSQLVNETYTTTSTTLAYESDKKQVSDSVDDIKRNECTNSGFIGDVKDCTKFYRCVYNGRGTFAKYKFNCSPGTVWDRKLEACNYAWAVKACGSKDFNENEIASEVTSSLYQTSSIHPVLMVDESVGYGNLHNFGENLNHDSSTLNASSGSFGDSYTNAEKCTKTGFLVDTSNCQIFYKCVDNGRGGFSKQLYKCDEGTLWDSNINACNYANLVKSCNQYQNYIVTTTIKNSGMYPEISFTNKQTTTQTNRLDDDYNGGYGHRAPTANKLSSTERSSNSKNLCTSSGFLGDIKDCKKFYRCVDNSHGGFNQYEFSCGEGTVWDPSIEACNHAWAVKNCGSFKVDQATTSQSTSYISDYKNNDDNVSPSSLGVVTTTKKPSTFTEDVNENKCHRAGFMGDNKDCEKFYRCVDNGNGGYTQYQFMCGEGTVWDSKIEACNHKNAVDKIYCGSSNESNEESTTRPSTSLIAGNHQTENTSPSEVITQKTTPVDITITNLIPSKDVDKCSTDGFMANSKDCRKFYRCVSDNKGSYTQYEFSCGEGTVWDQQIQGCNHEPEDGTCQINNDILKTTQGYKEDHINNNSHSSSTTPSIGDFPDTSSQISQTQKPVDTCISEGFYPDNKDCQKFYRCVDNGKESYTKFEFTCGDGTVWDQEIMSCNHKSNENNCKNINSPSVPQASTDSYISPSPVPVTQLQQQDTPSTSTSITMRPDATPEKENDEYDSRDCTVEGFFPNEKDCRQFYRCVYNEEDGSYKKYEFSCGEGTAWDINIRSCNHINEVKSCQVDKPPSQGSQVEPVVEDEQVSAQSTESTSTTKVSTTTSIAPLTTTQSNNKDVCHDEGFFGNSNDCKKFYRCVSNENDGFTKYDFICGDGTIWDQDILTCNHPQDVTNPSCNSTNDNTAIDAGSSSTTTSGSSSTTTSLSSSLPTSSTSTSSERTSTTSSSEESVSAENSSNKPDNQNYTCTKAGFYADPNDCKKFYRCVDWDNDGKRFSIYHFECGEGTIWDPALETCNHENSVYPPRDCSASEQNENSTQVSSSTTTEVAQTSESSSETTTQQSTTETTTSSTEKTTTEKSTTQTSTTKKTTPSSTTKQTTTTQSSTLQSTTEQTTTQASSTSEQTTKSSTTEQNTSTDKSTTSSENETTTSQQTSTTSDPMTTSDQTSTTTSEQTTEQTTQANKDESSSTTEKTTTQASTTAEQTTESQSSTTTESSQESTTQTSASEKECPETNDDENLYVCPTSFRRHPKYCNMFYQCTEEDDSHDLKIATFQCPNSTIYDESKTQCVEEKKADKKCNGEIAQQRRVKRLDGNFKEPIVVTKEKLGCPSPGYFIFEQNEECSSAFQRCKFTKKGVLQGLIYRCPEGYVYWSISRKCEAISRVKDCRRSRFDWSERHEIPIEILNVAYTKYIK